MPKDDPETGAHARGVQLFDEPLGAERGHVLIEAGGRQVDTGHRVEYDHDPPVEVDARFFGTMTEIAMEFEVAGRRGRALTQLSNEAMREFIRTIAPEVGLRVAEVDEMPSPHRLPETDWPLTCASCGDRVREATAVYDTADEDHETPYCSTRCWARGVNDEVR